MLVDNQGLPIGTIVGIAFGALVAVAIVIGIVVCCVKRHKAVHI